MRDVSFLSISQCLKQWDGKTLSLIQIIDKNEQKRRETNEHLRDYEAYL